ncbi:MAG: glucokinase [Thiothrix nivea]|nr:MAG: glucokinase [Thiothrix nivea]
MPEILKRLVMDIGGTNIRLGLLPEGSLSPRHIVSYKVKSFPGLAEVVVEYLQQSPAHQLEEASVALAGPVDGDLLQLTNHGWQFSVAEIRQRFSLQRLKVINDFTALALSLPHLKPEQLVQFGGGTAADNGTIALLGPGTGLGVSGLVRTAAGFYPLSGEGGHVSLGARTARELAIFSVFRDQYGHMSAERLVSGTGITEFYQVICRLDGVVADELSAGQISVRAVDGRCPRCAEVMTLFCEWLGIVASNLALTMGAVGGVYIGGGIVPKLGDYFFNSGFRREFEDKGRFREYLQDIPVFVIQDGGQPALMGAAASFNPRFSRLGIESLA